MAIRFTADLHLNDSIVFSHTRKNLFKDEVQFHNYLIRMWNSKVSNNDITVIIGDVGVPSHTTLDILKYLHGRKVLVIGNHDVEHLDYFSEVFISMKYVYHTYIEGKYICCRHKPVMASDILRVDSDIFIHGHHHQYDMSMLRHGAYALHDKNKYNACLDLNNFEPCTLSELKYNKPYQLQFFEDLWYKI